MLGLDHHGRKCPNRVIDSTQVRIQNLVPCFGGQLMEWTAKAADSRIVDQDVEPSVAGFKTRGELVDGPPTGDITFRYFCFPACCLDGIGGGLELGAGTCAQNDGGSQHRKPAGNGGSNAASRAGYGGHLVFQCRIAVGYQGCHSPFHFEP